MIFSTKDGFVQELKHLLEPLLAFDASIDKILHPTH